MVRAGILGATSYGAAELFRLLSIHPEFQISYVASESGAGTAVASAFPQLRGATSLVFESFEAERALERADVFFLTLKNGLAMKIAPELLAADRPLVDFSADFRLRDPAVYQQFYGATHACPELIDRAAYGLPELFRSDIARSKLVGNPGCYPTVSTLALAPLVRENMVDPRSIIIDATSGVTGVGRSAVSLENHFPEIHDSLTAYNVIGHRHTPEIEQSLERVAGHSFTITFTPHKAPINRGILATIYATIQEGVDAGSIREIYERAYADERFVVLLPEGQLPSTGAVRGSNYVHLSVQLDERTGRVTLIGAEDNLVKGMAGQAIQNMNLVCGLPEETGLCQTALYP